MASPTSLYYTSADMPALQTWRSVLSAWSFSRQAIITSKPSPVCSKLLSARLHPHPFYCIPTHDQGSRTANLSPRPIPLISTSSVCLLMAPDQTPQHRDPRLLFLTLNSEE